MSNDKPWIPWPEKFNAGTCDENEAWTALKLAEAFFDENMAFMAFFDRLQATGYRHSIAGYEFRLDQTCDDAPPLILRVWLDESRVERAEVRR